MEAVSEISVGEEGRTHLRTVLGASPGAAAVLSDLVLRSGRVYSLLPPGTSQRRALAFDQGGIGTFSSALGWLAAKLEQMPAGTLLFEDMWSDPADLAVLPPRTASHLVDETTVYYFLGPDRQSALNLIEVDRQISSFAVVCFLVVGAPDLTKQKRIESRTFSQLLPRIPIVCLSAYDRESFIVWEAVS